MVVEGDEVAGMAIGLINPNLWYPELMYLHQILLYVKPEYRNTRAAYNLLQAYNKEVDSLLEQKRIFSSTITAAEPLHDIDFGKYGYVMAEKVWQLEQ